MKSFNETGLEVVWTPGQKDYPRHSLTVTIKGTFRLQDNGVAMMVDKGDALPVDGDRHIGDDTEKSLEYATDFAFYKQATDILLKGNCHTPKGEALPVCKVSFGLEGEQHSLYVFGDRHWESAPLGGKQASKPEPFTKMPLCYENSFGGEGFDANPVGKGVSDELLPNIEHPDHLVLSPENRPQPAGFAPLHSLWQPRKRKMGTFSKQWEVQRWPWFPADMDWSLFNAAPAALQREGYLKGNETIVMENLHPDISNYRCRLPELRCRCFINGGHDKKVANFNEVALNLDTLWVEADEELLILVWRGIIPIVDRFHDELNHILLVTEPLASEPQLEQVYRDQLAADLKALEINIKPPVVPTEEPVTPSPEQMDVSDDIKKAMDSARASLSKMELPEETRDALNKEKNPVAFAELFLKALGATPDDLENLQKEAFLSKRQILVDHGQDPNMVGRLRVERIESRDDVIRYYAEGRDFSGADMSGLDLSGLDLQNAEFARAVLVNTQLQKSNLNGANLSYATLDGADLSEAKLENANLNWACLGQSKLTKAKLTSANLSEARLVGSDLAHADLIQAQMYKTTLNECVLTAANLSGADLSQAQLKSADLASAKLSDCNAVCADFSGANLNNTEMPGIDLNEAILNKVNLQQANLKAALLDKVQLQQAVLQGCDMTDVQANEAILDEAIMDKANLEGADFSQSSMKKVSLVGASLQLSRFRNSDLEQANLASVEGARADFSGALLISAQLQNAQFSDADFSNTNVSYANFTQANLKCAIFTGTNAERVNMQSADLSELRAGGGANFENANLQQVIAHGAIWMKSSLRQANLKWADMHGCNLNQTDLSDAYLLAVDLKKSDLTRANLTDANFTDSNLFECQLEKANVTRTNFSGSNMYGAFFFDNFSEGEKAQKSNFNKTNLKRTRLEEWDDSL